MPRIKVDPSDKNVTDTGIADSKIPSEAIVKSESPLSITDSDKNITNDSELDSELGAKSGKSFLTAFVSHPLGISFGQAEVGEDLIILLRAHIVTNLPWVLGTLILFLVPFVIFPILAASGALPNLGMGTGLVITIFWYLGVFTFAFLNLLYWLFNVYIVTNERVVDVDWNSVIFRKVSSTQIAKIQDVNAAQAGVFAGIFDYGDVQIQTAGAEENFEFKAVPHPQLVAKKIEELTQKEEHKVPHAGL